MALGIQAADAMRRIPSKGQTMKARRRARPPITTAICRKALLVAAEAELAEKGVEGFTLRGCAKRAGVSHAAPAHHFKDANALLTALAAEGFERFVAAMRKRQSQATDAARQAHRRRARLCRFRARQSGAVPADVLVVPAGLRPRAAETVRVDGVRHVGRGRARDSRRRSPGRQGSDARRRRRMGDRRMGSPTCCSPGRMPFLARDRRRRPGRRLRRDHPPRAAGSR